MKHFISILLCCCVFFTNISLVPIHATATYYISNQGSDDNNGSLTSPFKTLNQAYQKANDHDTIIVLDSALVADVQSNDQPFIIAKPLTIKGQHSDASILMRCGGITLGADVLFEDLIIGASSFIRPGIAANGHHLTLSNIRQDESLRPLQIYGGYFADYNGTIYGEEVRGTQSYIEITDGNYDEIYAGSINTTNILPVTFQIQKESSLHIAALHVASTQKDPSNLGTAGTIPQLANHLCSNHVSIELKDAYIPFISGHQNDHQVHLSIFSSQPYEPTIQYIDELQIEQGIISIKGETPISKVSLIGSHTQKAGLDLSHYALENETISFETLTAQSNTMIIINSHRFLSIQQFESQNPVEFRTSGGMPYASETQPGYSGWMNYDTSYITVQNGTGRFLISHPYPTQSDIYIDHIDHTWTTSLGDEFEPIKIIDYTLISQNATMKDINTEVSGYGKININALVNYHPDEYLCDLSYVPMDFKITYTNETETISYPLQSAILHEDGYYICNYMDHDQLLMKLEPIGNTINICKGDQDIACGTYDIEISLYTLTGKQTRTCTLNVLKSETIIEASSFTFTRENDVLYGDDVLFNFHLDSSLLNGSITLYNGTQKITTISSLSEDFSYSMKVIKENGFYDGYHEVSALYQSNDQLITQIKSDYFEVLKSNIYCHVSNQPSYHHTYNGLAYPFKNDEIQIMNEHQNIINEQPILGVDYTITYQNEYNQYVQEAIVPGTYTIYATPTPQSYAKEVRKCLIGTLSIEAAPLIMIPSFSEIEYEYGKAKGSVLVQFDYDTYAANPIGNLLLYNHEQQIIAHQTVNHSQVELIYDQQDISQVESFTLSYLSFENDVYQNKNQTFNMMKIEILNGNDDITINDVPTHHLYVSPQQKVNVRSTNNAFAYWKENNEIVSYQPSYEFHATKHHSLSANYQVKPNKVDHIIIQPFDYKTITLTWEAVEGATSYDVYRKSYKEGATFELEATVSEPTYVSTGMMTGKEYSYYVVAKNEAGVSEPSDVVSMATALQGEVTLTMEQVSTSKFHLSWNKVDGATRYIVYRKRNDDKMKKVLTLGANDLEYTTSEMPNGEYQFQVKAGRYDSIDRVMTGASNKVSGSVEAIKPTVTVTAGTKSAKISWKKMEGVTHYQVYRATSSTGKYTKLITTKELSYTAKSLSAGKKYYFKVRGYKTYKSGTDIQYNVYTPYSSVKSIVI